MEEETMDYVKDAEKYIRVLLTNTDRTSRTLTWKEYWDRITGFYTADVSKKATDNLLAKGWIQHKDDEVTWIKGKRPVRDIEVYDENLDTKIEQFLTEASVGDKVKVSVDGIVVDGKLTKIGKNEYDGTEYTVKLDSGKSVKVTDLVASYGPKESIRESIDETGENKMLAFANEEKERKELEKLVWRKTHKDYKGKSDDGQKSIMVPLSMGGGLAKLSSLSIQQLKKLAGVSESIEVERLIDELVKL
jgi:hypothetical protein